ncbi:MAG: HNH endonuclease [Pseudoclavibacter sp.]|nr:HNH endonuclease [Pseudoclavibacter sp.]
MNTSPKRRRRRDVVVLNASYEPLGVVDLRRAMVYLLAERADVVLADEHELLNGRIASPLVVAFREYIRVPFAGRRVQARWSRRLLLQRDGRRCAYCGGPGTTVDHIVPRSLGGDDSWLNTVAACRACNGRKADATLERSGMELRVRPRIVSREEVLLLAVERVATASGRREDFLELVPVLAGV